MAVYIHRKAQFIKRLNALRRGGKRPSLAAKRAHKIIRKLYKDDLGFLKETDNLTKHGELRIEKCRKYNLGSGYRLICVKHGKDLIVSYVGTHDDCCRWLDNNRRFEPELKEVEKEALLIVEEQEEDEGQPTDPDLDEEMDYDDILMKKIDDKLLREIFSALCKEES